MKNEKYITAMIILILFCSFISVTFKTNNKTYDPSFGIHDRFIPTTTGELDRLQWWIHNDGSFSNFNDGNAAWGIDKKKAVEGVDLSFDSAFDRVRQNRPLRIAVIDTGIDVFHPAIKKSIYINKKEIPGDRIDNDKNGFVDDYMGWNFYDGNNRIYESNKNNLAHGTAMLGILLGDDIDKGYTSVLSNYNVKAICVKALGGNKNSGSIFHIIEAIRYAEDMGAAICGLSVNTNIDDSQLEKTLKASKMLFVVSAGNEGLDIDKYGNNYPTCYQLPNVISVADLRCDGALSLTSNYGKNFVDIAAPGTNMLCAKPGGGYTFLSGSSLSVYNIASEAGLIYIHSRSKPRAETIKKIIIENVKKQTELQSKVLCGGFPDFEEAIDNSNR